MVEQMRKQHQMTEYARQQSNKMANEHKWITNEKEFFGIRGSKFDFKKMNISRQRDDRKKLIEENDDLKKRVNMKVDAMFEKTESQYLELQRKKETTIENKVQFERTIEELDQLKNKEVDKTYKAVSKYCAEIYSTLLQGASAKLAPPSGKTVADGLELKVSFSGTFKESLSELSGG